MEGGIMADLRASGLGGVPKGQTADRPASPSIGDVFYNGTLGCLEIYTSQGWVANSAPPAIPISVIATDQGSSRAFNNGQASIAFTPGSNGGISSDYEVIPSPSTTPSSFTGGSSPITVTGLQSSTQYTYTVKARNNFGTSGSSTASSPVTATTVPQAPTIGTASSVSATSVSLTFTAGSTGGSAITNYKYSTNGSTYTALSPAQTSSPLTISGLTTNQSYNIYIKAVNANGDSLASSASNSVTPVPSFDIMVIAGGGGTTSGGGGAGGFRVISSQTLTTGATYTATIGGGGSGATQPNTGSNGTDSSFSGLNLSTITSSGGGRGGSINADTASSGGSGGGGGRASVGQWSTKSGNIGGYTPSEGNSGGAMLNSNPYNGGGGGGAGAAGANATTAIYPSAGAAGGVGTSAYSSWGLATSSGENVGGTVYYAGGGGSGGDGGNSPGGVGGYGGGGAGAYNGVGTNGTANTGGGAGGGSNASGGTGGSGIVILRTAGSYTAASTTNSPTRYETGGYTYYKFTTNGTIVI
jgi:hypothetical protein